MYAGYLERWSFLFDSKMNDLQDWWKGFQPPTKYKALFMESTIQGEPE